MKQKEVGTHGGLQRAGYEATKGVWAASSLIQGLAARNLHVTPWKPGGSMLFKAGLCLR
jgi:hypothetical protein